MNNYVWKITSMSTLPSPPAPIENCAVLVLYTVTASNKDNPKIIVNFNNFAQFDVLPTNDNLTPYSELTDEMVIEWIQSEPNLALNIQANLDGQIESQINPPINPVVTPLPWVTE